MKKIEYNFCMSQFKLLVALLTVLIIMVLSWATWNCKLNNKRKLGFGLALAAAAQRPNPPASSINVKNKMRHPYWGNCNKCHITLNPPSKPISKVFAGPPISINDPMTHEYWGNCIMCHKVIDGFKAPPKNPAARQIAAAIPAPPISNNAIPIHPDWGKCTNCHQILHNTGKKNRVTINTAAFNSTNSHTLGLKVKAVNAGIMQKLGLRNEDGILILSVAVNSIADRSGLKKGDEIIRIDKIRTETMQDFSKALSELKPGNNTVFNIYRGNKSRNLFVSLPQNLIHANVHAQPKQSQNRIETRIEHAGQYNNMTTNQPLQQAAQKNFGKVAIASSGPGITNKVAKHFEASPYFIVYSPKDNIYKSIQNPNFNDITGRGIQTGQYMVDLEVDNVIAGSLSTNAYATLRSFNINVFSGVRGSVSDILTMYKNNQIQPNRMNPYSVIIRHQAPNNPISSAPQQAAGGVF